VVGSIANTIRLLNCAIATFIVAGSGACGIALN
jgi:hypothetical protein